LAIEHRPPLRRAADLSILLTAAVWSLLKKSLSLKPRQKNIRTKAGQDMSRVNEAWRPVLCP
jgi:hypothetical protein